MPRMRRQHVLPCVALLAFVIGSVHSGYTCGPYMARLLAQLILGQEPEMPLFDPARLLTDDATAAETTQR